MLETFTLSQELEGPVLSCQWRERRLEDAVREVAFSALQMSRR